MSADDDKRQLPLVPSDTEACTQRELDDAMLHVHEVERQLAARLAQMSANVNALAEVLIGDGTVALEEYEDRRALTMKRERERAQRDAHVLLSDDPDKYQLDELPVVDCASLMPICKARCCRLEVTLSEQDLDERVLRWDYRQPYLLKKRPTDGYCVHSCDDGGCGVYEKRPATCRTYDCREDTRIWLDFDNRVLAEEAVASQDMLPADGLASGSRRR